jgi:hypothetical protein
LICDDCDCDCVCINDAFDLDRAILLVPKGLILLLLLLLLLYDRFNTFGGGNFHKEDADVLLLLEFELELLLT